MKAIIIAGGLGTRLRPLTYDIPKPIIPMANRPFVFHQIELLKKFGISDIILNLHYMSDNIKNILSEVQKMGVKVSFSLEDKPLGTAGAVKNAEEYFDDGPMLVFNGDILTDINLKKLIDFHKQKKATVSLTLKNVDDPTPYGLIITGDDGRVQSFIEKPNWDQVKARTINAGVYIVEPGIFKKVPKGKPFSFERQLYPILLEEGEKIYGYISDAYWKDIGDPAKYLQAHRDILAGDVMVNVPGNKIGAHIWVEEGAVISSSAKVRGPALLGKNSKVADNVDIHESVVLGERVEVGKGTQLKDCVILAGTTIGENVKIEDTVIGENSIIEDNAAIGHDVVIASRSVIRKGSKIGRLA